MFFPFFDPLYLILLAPPFVLAMWAQSRVRGTYQKYSQVMSSTAMPASEAARRILDSVGLYGVEIKRVPGELTDHYDPRLKLLRLSDGVYGSNSIAAVAIAAHEAGHAMQDKVQYPWLVMRSAMVPVTTFGSKFGYGLLIAGFLLASFVQSPIGVPIAVVGLGLFSTAFVFAVVTLPVEFNASARALRSMESVQVINATERVHAKSVLDAAALTYVATMSIALMQVIYFALRLLGLSRR